MSENSEKKHKSSDEKLERKIVLFVLNFYVLDHHSKDTYYAL